MSFVQMGKLRVNQIRELPLGGQLLGLGIKAERGQKAEAGWRLNTSVHSGRADVESFLLGSAYNGK